MDSIALLLSWRGRVATGTAETGKHIRRFPARPEVPGYGRYSTPFDDGAEARLGRAVPISDE